MREKLIQVLKKHSKLTLDQCKNECHCQSSSDLVSLMKSLNSLEQERCIYNNHKYIHWIEENFYIGKIKSITPFQWIVSSNETTLYVDKDRKSMYFVGDEVLVSKESSPKIVHVYHRAKTQITGSMVYRKKQAFFYSNENFHCDFFVKNAYSFPFQKNDVILAKITKYTQPLEIELVQVLGKKSDVGMDITSLLYESNARMLFPDSAIQQAQNLPKEVIEKEYTDRVDHRNLFTITIDGDDAKDFDDAISLEKVENGWILYVHIADVTHYIKEKSALDKEAYLRSTSIYVCDRVVPMLPFELSNGICSLNPQVDRCTLTCKMVIDTKGKCIKSEVYPSVIHSNHRCTYNLVNQLYDENSHSHPYAAFSHWLLELSNCAQKLRSQSLKRGKIDFESREPLITINDKGIVMDVKEKSRGWSEEIIEECMILANTQVAHKLHKKNFPCMYRIHEKPDQEKMEDMMQLSMVFGVPWKENMEKDPKAIQSYLNQIQDEELKKCFSYIMLRSMQKAQYDNRCIGHFGLGLQEYCHFTSPIRRYSDVVVHRMIKKYIFNQESMDEKDHEKIRQQSQYVSLKERDAITIERKINAIKMAQYMKRHIGHHFEGWITSVHEFGCFVALDNCIEGLIPVHSLNDYYTYNPATFSLSSPSNKHILQIGQKVKVKVWDVNIEKGQVEFQII